MKKSAIMLLGTSHVLSVAIGIALSKGDLAESWVEEFTLTVDKRAVADRGDTGSDKESGKGERVGNKASTSYASAWESLKDRFLPRIERLSIQKALLEDWSVVDLKAAVEAALAEEKAVELLDSCKPGIIRDPNAAWQLARSRAFGWETAVFRAKWISLMAEEEPAQIFRILDEVSLAERLQAVDSVGYTWARLDAQDPRRKDLLAQLAGLDGRSDGAELRFEVASAISGNISPEERETLMSENLTPEETKLIAASYAFYALYSDNRAISRVIAEIPESMRGEFATTGLRALNLESERALPLAKLAIQEGRLDAFSESFYREPELETDFARWALDLPDDPRVMGVFSMSVEQLSWDGFGEMTEFVRGLPKGRKRDHGAAALVRSMSEEPEEFENPDEVIKFISDPEIRAAALKRWNEREKD